jgi:peptide/nickel transport system substrate-binding protein
MENRFGIKDFFLFLLLIALIAVVILAMEQYDRQWEVMSQIKEQLSEQTTDLSRIHRLLEQGVPAATTATATGNATDSMAGFERIIKAQSAPDYATGGQLTMLSQASPEKITPLISDDGFAATLWGYVMDSLVNRDPDTLQWTPNLATSWKISDDSLTIDFTLRKGVTFSDGSPLTADDVVFTFDLIRNPDLADPGMKAMVDRLDRVEKVDDYHVRFIFREPYFQSFIVAGGTPIMSKAFYSKYSIADINNSTGLLIGSSAYRMPDPTNWRPTPGQPIVLVRNERYWGPTPSFDKLVWSIIEQPASRVTAFRNGELDVMTGSDGPPTPEQYSQLITDPQINANTHHWALTVPTEAWYYLGWNEKVKRDGPPSQFADPRVRRALTMLTDRQAILQTIIHGYGTIITSPFAPNTPQCDSTIQPWPYDAAAAEKLLNDAGYHRVGDRMVGPDGKPLAFEILFNNNSEPRRRIASFLHDAYAQLGIEATPKGEEWSVFSQRIDERDFDVIIGAWGSDLETDPYDTFDSSQIPKTGRNFIQYSNPQLDALIRQGRSVLDDSKRMPIWHQVQQIMHQDQPYTFLFKYQELDLVHDRIHGVFPTKVLGLNGTGEWYLPKALQMAQ